jgi:predicted ArsR family transcriptional regulator
MTDSPVPGKFDNVDEAVGCDWEAETTPYDRVREVISYTYTPVSAPTVAEEARTSPKTARKHLDALTDEGFATAETGENGGTRYRRSRESLVVEQAADILARLSTEELVDRIEELRGRVATFREEYGVESPEELAVERTNRALAESADTDSIDPETRREWQRTRRNLAFANAALSIANAERFVGGESGPAGERATSR